MISGEYAFCVSLPQVGQCFCAMRKKRPADPRKGKYLLSNGKVIVEMDDYGSVCPYRLCDADAFTLSNPDNGFGV